VQFDVFVKIVERVKAYKWKTKRDKYKFIWEISKLEKDDSFYTIRYEKRLIKKLREKGWLMSDVVNGGTHTRVVTSACLN
jgi:hypothetical protein